MKIRAFLLHIFILFALLSCSAPQANDEFLIVTVDYSSGMMGSVADLTIIHQVHPFVWMPAQDQAAMPLDVVFRDDEGEVVTRKSMTVAHFDHSLMYLDAPLTVRWVTWIENDPRFACVEIETANASLQPNQVNMQGVSLPICEN